MYNTFPFLSRGDLMKRVIENLENKNEQMFEFLVDFSNRSVV